MASSGSWRTGSPPRPLAKVNERAQRPAANPAHTPTTLTSQIHNEMTTRASEVKNIWIAAGDGDVERVKVGAVLELNEWKTETFELTFRLLPSTLPGARRGR